MSLSASTPVARRDSSRAGLVQISLAGALWGTGGLVVQLIRERVDMSALTIGGYRMVIAAVVLLAVVVGTGAGPALLRLVRARPVRAVVVGCGTGAYQALYFAAVVAGGVTVATVVSLGLAPVLLAVVDLVRTRARPTTRRLVVLTAALAGLVLVSVAGHEASGGPKPGLGVVLAAASGTTYALTTLLGRGLANAAPPLVVTAATTSAGALLIAPLAALAAASGAGPLVTTDAVVLAWLAYLGVATMALAYGLLYAALRTTTAGAAVIATLVEPATAAVVAWLVLGERLTPAVILGVVLIMAAVAGLGRETPTAHAPRSRVRSTLRTATSGTADDHVPSSGKHKDPAGR
jgi:drug/metabolite transporter, DME family